MSKTKSYTLLSGKFRQGGEVFKPGDTVELTEAQAKAFADAIQPAEAAAEPKVTGTKQMQLAKKVVEPVEDPEEDDEGEEDTGEGEDAPEAKAPAAPAAKPVASKPAATSKPVAKQASK